MLPRTVGVESLLFALLALPTAALAAVGDAAPVCTEATRACYERAVRMIVDVPDHELTVFALCDVASIDGAPAYTVRRAQRLKIEPGLITEVERIFFIDRNPNELRPQPQPQ